MLDAYFFIKVLAVDICNAYDRHAGTWYQCPVAELPLPEINTADENRPKYVRSPVLVLLLQLITGDEIR